MIKSLALVIAAGLLAGCGSTPSAAPEAALLGADWNSASIERACAALASDFTPLSDFRASKISFSAR